MKWIAEIVQPIVAKIIKEVSTMSLCIVLAISFASVSFLFGGVIQKVLIGFSSFFFALAGAVFISEKLKRHPVANAPCNFHLFPVRLGEFPDVEWMACLKIDWVLIEQEDYPDFIIMGEAKCSHCGTLLNISSRQKRAWLVCPVCQKETVIDDYPSTRERLRTKAVELAMKDYKQHVERIVHSL